MGLLEICVSDSRVLCITHNEGQNITGYLERLYHMNMLDMVFLDEGERHGDLLSDLLESGKIGKSVPIYTIRHHSLPQCRLDYQGLTSFLLRFHLKVDLFRLD